MATRVPPTPDTGISLRKGKDQLRTELANGRPQRALWRIYAGFQDEIYSIRCGQQLSGDLRSLNADFGSSRCDASRRLASHMMARSGIADPGFWDSTEGISGHAFRVYNHVVVRRKM